MILGPRGVALIQSFEKCALKAYPDQGGIWTIGWGHTGPEAYEGATCTQAQADLWFQHDVARAVGAVISQMLVPVTQNQFDALVAFTFNVGVTAEGHSTLLRDVNEGRFAAAADEFPKWNHVKGVVSAGLTKRRAAERALFLEVA